LVELVRSGQFDLLHAHTPRTALLTAIAARVARVPWVYHVHSPAASDSTHGWQNRLNAVVEHLSLSRASALIAVSESLGKRLRRWRRFRDRVFVVPNGVPCQEPRPTRVPGAGDWTLGTIALFRPRKGLEVLLDSLAVLSGRGIAVRLRAVGEFETSEYRRQILARADALGLGNMIDWTGFARDVNRQLAHMDVFVLPSLFGEGLPMVVLEAMAGGVPVVASRVEGVPEAIRDGFDGLLVEPNDPHSLAEAIARLVGGQADWAAMRSSALERHARCFSDEAMAAGVSDVYRRVLPRLGELP
jgi:glycosyltransferase involved in cell wall biosynthesis